MYIERAFPNTTYLTQSTMEWAFGGLNCRQHHHISHFTSLTLTPTLHGTHMSSRRANRPQNGILTARYTNQAAVRFCVSLNKVSF
jgi:hypothetical protein